MNKVNKVIPELKEYAQRSEMERKHAAIIIYNGQILNFSNNTFSSNGSLHAEMNSINRFLNDRGLSTSVKSKWCFKPNRRLLQRQDK